MAEKIRATITAELIEVYETREEAVADLAVDDGEVFFVARNMFQEQYGSSKWATYQLMTVDKEEVI